MKISLKKTVTAAMLAALTVALSGFYIPVSYTHLTLPTILRV